RFAGSLRQWRPSSHWPLARYFRAASVLIPKTGNSSSCRNQSPGTIANSSFSAADIVMPPGLKGDAQNDGCGRSGQRAISAPLVLLEHVAMKRAFAYRFHSDVQG